MKQNDNDVTLTGPVRQAFLNRHRAGVFVHSAKRGFRERCHGRTSFPEVMQHYTVDVR
jgi:hypothetical protein